MHRRPLFAAAALPLVILAALCVSPRVPAVVDALPDRLKDDTFWRLVEDFSEPGGYFRSDNLISNEDAYQHVIPALNRRLAPGGVYIGVGPDQNFTYVVAVRPRMAFIVDIRRQNMLLHLMYKGLVELSTDRAALLSRLFSRKRPASVAPGWSARALFDAYQAEPPSAELFRDNLAAVTGHDGYKDLAHRFDHERFFAPLGQGRDELKGLHANTNIPKVVGAARRYELTGELRYRRIAEYFWRQVTTQRAYCTGGTSNGEGWNAEPGVLSTELSGYTQEDCTTYNMLKLTRHIFGWTADPACADFYERALFNGIIGSQHPRDGEKLYYVNLAAGLWKLFGTPGQDYWCCTGTMSESFSQFGDSIYFHEDAGVYVNLFIASELNWSERGVRLVQETRFPEEEGTTLRIQTAKPVRFALRIRVPYWATHGGTAVLNGHGLDGFAAPGGYYVLDRTWRNGDTVAVKLPMSLHLHAMPDDPTLAAVMYGPLVLAGRLGTEGLTPDVLRAEPTKPRTIPEYKGQPIPAPELRAQGAERVAGRGLEFRAAGEKGAVTLVPFHTIFDERYAIYWRLTT